jgi:MFS family permease
MAYPLHAVCTAHANDLVLPKRAFEVSSGLLLMFSAGAILGPLLASLAVATVGHAALFLTSATAHGAIAVVMILRLLVRPRPKKKKPVFVPVLETTPQAFDLAPRSESGEEPAQAR